MNQKEVTLAYIVLSSSAAGMVLAVTFFSSSNGQMLSSFDRLVISSALLASCVLGIVSSSKVVHFRRANGPGSRDDISSGSRRQHIGHHPDCEGFKDHTVTIGGRTRCSGCLGLGLGCIIGLLLIMVYLIAPGIAPDQGSALVAIGLLMVLTNLVETAHHSRTPAWHMMANAILPVGFVLVTVGAAESTGKVAIGLLAVLISFLWLETRIHISDWKHAEICRKCGRECRSY
jgi:hypothetical protein